MGEPNHRDSSARGKIQAKTEIDDRADDIGLLYLAPPDLLPGKRQAAPRIGLPEIDPRPQPVVGVVAVLEGLSGHQPVADPAITTVIAENEGRGQTMHDYL